MDATKQPQRVSLLSQSSYTLSDIWKCLTVSGQEFQTLNPWMPRVYPRDGKYLSQILLLLEGPLADITNPSRMSFLLGP